MNVRERVLAGAAFLDETEPGWWRRVDIRRLDMKTGFSPEESTKTCLVCQVTKKSYFVGASGLGFVGSGGRAFSFGFYTNKEAEWPVLDEEWRAVVSERQRGGGIEEAS